MAVLRQEDRHSEQRNTVKRWREAAQVDAEAAIAYPIAMGDHMHRLQPGLAASYADAYRLTLCASAVPSKMRALVCCENLDAVRKMHDAWWTVMTQCTGDIHVEGAGARPAYILSSDNVRNFRDEVVDVAEMHALCIIDTEHEVGLRLIGLTPGDAEEGTRES